MTRGSAIEFLLGVIVAMSGTREEILGELNTGGSNPPQLI